MARDEHRDHAGRDASRPSQLGKRGWKQILSRVKQELSADRVALLAAGVAFYAMLAMVPTLIALVSIYGLAFDPADLQQQIETVAGSAPQGVQDLLHDQLQGIVESSSGGLTTALVLALLGALWSASSGMQGLLQAVGAAYDEPETRSAVKLRLTALAATLGTIVVFVLVVGLIAVLPPLLDGLGLGSAVRTLIVIARWPVLAALAFGFVAMVYRIGPDRDAARWRWLSWGAGIAVALWLVASGLFSLYVTNFGSYDKTYGSLAAVIVVMLWLWITAFVVLLGAEINAEMEHQTTRDTTRGEPQPIGHRGAHVADHVAGEPRERRSGQR